MLICRLSKDAPMTQAAMQGKITNGCILHASWQHDNMQCLDLDVQVLFGYNLFKGPLGQMLKQARVPAQQDPGTAVLRGASTQEVSSSGVASMCLHEV